MWITNAFSLNMLAEVPATVRVRGLGEAEAAELAKSASSAVGHEDTAAVFAAELGVPVPAARVTVALKKGDRALVGQYIGPRLPVGATRLPEGATIKWFIVTIE